MGWPAQTQATPPPLPAPSWFGIWPSPSNPPCRPKMMGGASFSRGLAPFGRPNGRRRKQKHTIHYILIRAKKGVLPKNFIFSSLFFARLGAGGNKRGGLPKRRPPRSRLQVGSEFGHPLPANRPCRSKVMGGASFFRGLSRSGGRMAAAGNKNTPFTTY